MKLIETKNAVGSVLCHDITRIIKGVEKGPVFRKGHIVREEDIPVLLSVGKEHLYVWEKEEGMLHEDEGAEILREVCQGGSYDDAYGPEEEKKVFNHMSATLPKEGKIELIAEEDGLLKINRKGIYTVNSFGRMMIATRHGNTAVRRGDKLCGTRIIPLVIEKETMDSMRAELAKVTEEPLIRLMPFKKKRFAVINTGSEVFKGRIKDTFTPVLIEKMKEYGGEMINHTACDDDNEAVTAKINEFIAEGADIVLCTGGMSVDPDDKTPLAIKNTGADIVSYGAPVLPGAMFMLAYTEEGKAIMGLPGCVMYAKRTIFDLVLPRIMADDKVSAEELYSLGEGGLCLGCPVCTYPNCGFGKGGI